MGQDAPQALPLTVSLLGRIAIHTDSTIVPMNGDKLPLLLSLLCLTPGRAVANDQLLDALWRDQVPTDASATLRQHIRRLRILLTTIGAPAPQIVHRAPGYALEIAGERIDAVRFGTLLARSAEADPRRSLSRLEAGLQLWGEPYPGLTDHELLSIEARRLHELHEAALEDRAEMRLRLGDPYQAAVELEGLVRADPLRERRSMLLMIALYRTGRQAAALSAYDRLRRVLDDELGLVPSAEIRQIHAAVLAQDDQVLDRQVPGQAEQAPAASRSTSLPWWLETALATPMHGRDDLVVELIDQIERPVPAPHSDAHVLLLRGEAGIGKTRLLAELASRMAGRGVRVLAGWCDADGIIPFRPLTEALRHMVDGRSAQLWPAAVTRAANQITRYISDVDPGRPADDPETDRLRYFEGVASLLRRAGEHFSLLVVIDDSHWLDPSSAALLRYLLRQPAAHRMVLVACYRSDPTEYTAAWSRLLAELGQSAHCAIHELNELSSDAATRVVLDVMAAPQHAATEALARRILPISGGNPLFVREVALAAAAATQDHGQHVPIPVSRLDATSDRLDRLTAATREVIKAAAVLGQSFDLDDVAAVAGCSAEDALTALEEARSARFIDEVPDRIDRFAFRHALLRASVHDLMSRSRRSRAHLAAGELLGRRSGPDAVLGRAHHLLEAVPLCPEDLAARASVEAARVSLDALAFEEAVRVLERALELAEPSSAVADTTRFDLLLELGRVRSYRGENEASEQAFAAAADIARGLHDPTRLALAALGDDLDTRALTPSADRLALLREAVAALGESDDSLQIAVASAYVATASVAIGPAEVRVLASKTVARARRIGDPAVLAKALLAWLTCAYASASPEERLAVSTEALRLAEGAGQPSRAARARLARIGNLIRIGQVAEAKTEHQRYREQAESTKVPRHLWHADVVDSTLCRLSGDFDQANRLAQSALEVGRRYEVAEAPMVFAAHTFFVHFHRGRLADLADVMRAHARSRTDMNSWQLSAALAAVAVEDRTAAAYVLDTFVEQLPDLDPESEFWATEVMLATQLAAELDADASVAEQLTGRLQPRQGQFEVFGATTGTLGPVDRALGVLAAMRGDHDAAPVLHAAALEQCRTMSANSWLVWSGVDLAVELFHIGRDREAAKVKDLIRPTAEALGMARSQFKRLP